MKPKYPHCGKLKTNFYSIAGHGHFEINMTKALFKLLWELCLVDLAKMLGFKSPKALASCQSAHAINKYAHVVCKYRK